MNHEVVYMKYTPINADIPLNLFSWGMVMLFITLVIICLNQSICLKQKNTPFFQSLHIIIMVNYDYRKQIAPPLNICHFHKFLIKQKTKTSYN